MSRTVRGEPDGSAAATPNAGSSASGAVGGFKNDAPQHAEFYRPRFTIPSVHVIGRRDGIIPPHESQELADQFVDATVLTHPDGHIVPDTREVVDGVAGFLDRMRVARRLDDSRCPVVTEGLP